jgi:hypothetical protein
VLDKPVWAGWSARILLHREFARTWLGSAKRKLATDESLPLDSSRILFIDNGSHRINLPDVPLAHEGFFAAHFFAVSDQEKSKDFHDRILGGKVIKPEHPCYIKLANTWIILNSGGGPTPDGPEVLLETPSDLNRVNSFLNLGVADRPATNNGATKECFSYRAIKESRLGMELLHARSRWLPHLRSANILKRPSIGSKIMPANCPIRC